MRRGLRLMVALVSGLAMGTILYAQGFTARTGTWEFTMVIKGAMPMEGVPPEVAAQIQAELSKPQTTTSCLTAADLKNLRLGRTGDSDDEDCKVLSSRSTAKTADVTRECAGDEPYVETMHFEAPSPQVLTGNVSRKTPKGTMTMTMNGKWVAAVCME